VSQWLEVGSPAIIAHRGASASAPENTLSSFYLAVDQEAAAIELDVRLSSDGWPVVIHDATVDRTTNGQGAVSKLTVKELQSLDAGDGGPVPTLDQVFETNSSPLPKPINSTHPYSSDSYVRNPQIWLLVGRRTSRSPTL